MSVVWVICGAGRGVGKTTLAEKLCAVLPNSLYAKCGHGTRRAGKPENFFPAAADLEKFVESEREAAGHIVVECNAWALAGKADIVVFIDGVPGKTRFRMDADDLRRAAHLRISAHASRADWRSVLQELPGIGDLSAPVCDALSAQQRYLFSREPSARSKVWLDAGGVRVFGPGLARLLESIDRLGTLRGAADALGMSYRHAWNLIRVAEKRLGRELVVRQPGGANGGSSVISDDGRQMLSLFRRLDNDVAAYTDRRLSELRGEETGNA